MAFKIRRTLTLLGKIIYYSAHPFKTFNEWDENTYLTNRKTIEDIVDKDKKLSSVSCMGIKEQIHSRNKQDLTFILKDAHREMDCILPNFMHDVYFVERFEEYNGAILVGGNYVPRKPKRRFFDRYMDRINPFPSSRRENKTQILVVNYIYLGIDPKKDKENNIKKYQQNLLHRTM